MKKGLLILLALILLFAGCSAVPSATKRELFAMDTVMNLTVYGENQILADEAEQEIRRLETLLSVNSTTGDVYTINNSSGHWVTISEETADLLQSCVDFSRETSGLFDVTVYPAVQTWGFTKDTQTVPDDNTLQALLPLINYEAIEINRNQVRLKEGMGIDLGGIAKGYAADYLAELYEENNASGVLSLGGNVLTVGQKPDGKLFTVGVQDPANTTDTLGTLQVSGGTAVVTSGDYQRYFEQDGTRYHHILDPRTAAPAQSDLTSVTVVTSSAAYADALSTALFVMGLTQGLDFVCRAEGVEAVFVTKENKVFYTGGLTFTPESENYQFAKAGE